MANTKENTTETLTIPDDALVDELAVLIEQSKLQIISHNNSVLTFLFWQVGRRINTEILKNKRAQYGRQIVSTVSTQLESKYGRNFEEKNLRRMLQFAEQFDDEQIVVTLSRQLSWSHFLALLPIKNMGAKLFYANLAASQGLGIRDLRKRISAKDTNWLHRLKLRDCRKPT